MYKIDLEKNQRVKKLLQAQVGAKTDLSQFVVFELMANDTLPITRAGGLLLNSRMTATYLSQMAEKITTGNFVPVIQLHAANKSLPVGRVLDAKVYDNPTDFNQKNLHLLVYMQADNPDAIKIDAGIINEVSTGTTPSAVTCSACDFNFYANEDTRRKLWAGKNYTPLCDNGHQWGMNGNHLQLSGMKEFREISIVTRGAVPTAKVIKAENALLAAETSEINLSAYFNADILLSTTENATFAGFEKPANLAIPPVNDTGAKMGDINLSQEDYAKLVKDQGKLEHLTAELAQEKQKAIDAISAKDKAEADKALAETKLAEKDGEIATLTAERDQNKADLTAAEAKIAVYAAGGKPDGQGSGNPAGSGNNDDVQTPILAASFFSANAQ